MANQTGGNSSTGNREIRGVRIHGGQYVRYNVYDNLFEVSTKYVPRIRPIGRGAYGLVCAAVNSETREEVAIKKIGNAFDNRIDAKRTLGEIKLLRHMDHENIIAIKDLIRPPKKETFNDVYIVYELLDTGLHQIIQSEQPLTNDHCQEYTAAVDVWSVGCILGEIMTREPLFPGKDYVHQLRLITELLGSPDDASLQFLRSDNARRYVRQLPKYPKQQFSARFHNMSPMAVDLLEKMLVSYGVLLGSPDDASLQFLRSDNARRYVRQLPKYGKQQFSARFPNMSPMAVDLLEKMLVFDPTRWITDINDEPICPRSFSFDFEEPSITEEKIKELVWRESVKFYPDFVEEKIRLALLNYVPYVVFFLQSIL
ncbi:hypothetical protein RND71_016773 [Anisodus tanguticus]|uniref:Protein kinase domain-containing protein n=1 Tax=Anisodus tanguticus TaxID=243964 RepID=A0AAE1S8H4_9SOLA|nr:hypothetical protein RND71_016773 [Anisodus tanguticus]